MYPPSLEVGIVCSSDDGSPAGYLIVTNLHFTADYWGGASLHVRPACSCTPSLVERRLKPFAHFQIGLFTFLFGSWELINLGTFFAKCYLEIFFSTMVWFLFLLLFCGFLLVGLFPSETGSCSVVQLSFEFVISLFNFDRAECVHHTWGSFS